MSDGAQPETSYQVINSRTPRRNWIYLFSSGESAAKESSPLWTDA
jgi:hypothetical protein